jgi:hypothetical protein
LEELLESSALRPAGVQMVADGEVNAAIAIICIIRRWLRLAHPLAATHLSPWAFNSNAFP